MTVTVRGLAEESKERDVQQLFDDIQLKTQKAGGLEDFFRGLMNYTLRVMFFRGR